MNFYRKIFIKFLLQIPNYIGLIVIGILIARLLGPELKGEYEIIILIPSILIVFGNLGLPVSNVYYIAKYKRIESKILGNTLLINLIFSLIIITMLFLLLPVLKVKIWNNLDLDLSRIALFGIFFHLNFINFIKIFEGKKEFSISSLYELLYVILWLILIVTIFFVNKFKLQLTVYVWIISIFILFLIQFFHLIIKYKVKLSSNLIKNQLFFGVRVYLSQFFSYLNYRIDIFILGIISGFYYVGIYSIAVLSAEMLWKPTQQIVTIFLPFSSENKNKNNYLLTLFIARITFTIGLILGIIGIVFGKFLIILFFGKDFLPSYISFIILIPGIVIFNIARILAIDIIGQGKPEINIYFLLTSLILNIILNIILIPLLNEIGASIATMISYFFVTLLFIWYYRRKYKFNLKDILIIKKEDFILLKEKIKTQIFKEKLSDQ